MFNPAVIIIFILVDPAPAPFFLMFFCLLFSPPVRSSLSASVCASLLYRLLGCLTAPASADVALVGS